MIGFLICISVVFIALSLVFILFYLNRDRLGENLTSSQTSETDVSPPEQNILPAPESGNWFETSKPEIIAKSICPAINLDLFVMYALDFGAQYALKHLAESIDAQDAQSKRDKINKYLKNALPTIIDKAIAQEEGLSQADEDNIVELLDNTDVAMDDLPYDVRIRLVKAAVVRDLLNGVVSNRLQLQGALPFVFQKKEILIWYWPNVTTYKMQSIRCWSGSNSGVSIRVARGIYWRTGSTRGYSFDSEYQQKIGDGMLVVTNKHIYYQGDSTAFRIKLDKIVSVVTYSDAVLIYKDGVKGGTVLFETDDAVFLANCISNGKNWT